MSKKEEAYRQYGFDHVEDEIDSLRYANASGQDIHAWLDGAFTAVVKFQQKEHGNRRVAERLYKIADLIAGNVPMDPGMAAQMKQIFKDDTTQS